MNRAVSKYREEGIQEVEESLADRLERQLRGAEGADQLEMYEAEEMGDIGMCARVLAFLKYLRSPAV